MTPLTRFALKQLRGALNTVSCTSSIGSLQCRTFHEASQGDTQRRPVSRNVEDAIQQLKKLRKAGFQDQAVRDGIRNSKEMQAVIDALKRSCSSQTTDDITATLHAIAREIRGINQASPEIKQAAQDAWNAMEAKISQMKREDVISLINALMRLGMEATSAMRKIITDIALKKAGDMERKSLTHLLSVASKVGVDAQVKEHILEGLSQLASTLTLRDVGPLLGTFKQAGTREVKCLEACRRLIAQGEGSLKPHEMKKLQEQLNNF